MQRGFPPSTRSTVMVSLSLVVGDDEFAPVRRVVRPCVGALVEAAFGEDARSALVGGRRRGQVVSDERRDRSLGRRSVLRPRRSDVMCSEVWKNVTKMVARLLREECAGRSERPKYL